MKSDVPSSNKKSTLNLNPADTTQKSYFVLPLNKTRHNMSKMSEEELRKFQDSSIRRFLDPLK
jgi:hypothetical protein